MHSAKELSTMMPPYPPDAPSTDEEDLGVEEFDYEPRMDRRLYDELPRAGESDEEARIRRHNMRLATSDFPGATFKMFYKIEAGACHQLSEKVIFDILDRISGCCLLRDDIRKIVSAAEVSAFTEHLEGFRDEVVRLARGQGMKITKTWYFYHVKERFAVETAKAAAEIEKWFAADEWDHMATIENAARSVAQSVKSSVRADLRDPNPYGECEPEEDGYDATIVAANGTGSPFSENDRNGDAVAEENDREGDAVAKDEDGGHATEAVVEQISREIARYMKWEVEQELLSYFKEELKYGFRVWSKSGRYRYY